MDRNMFGGRFVIPSASLSLFNTISIIALIPIYDRGVVPLLQKFGIKISHLQRIGELGTGRCLWQRTARRRRALHACKSVQARVCKAEML